MAHTMRACLPMLGLLMLVAFPARGDVTPARQAELRHLLKQDCGSCHGMTLKGGLGPSLLSNALTGKSTEMLTQAILDGRPGTAMPPWRGLLTVEDARWLAALLVEGAPDE